MYLWCIVIISQCVTMINNKYIQEVEEIYTYEVDKCKKEKNSNIWFYFTWISKLFFSSYVYLVLCFGVVCLYIFSYTFLFCIWNCSVCVLCVCVFVCFYVLCFMSLNLCLRELNKVYWTKSNHQQKKAEKKEEEKKNEWK